MVTERSQVAVARLRTLAGLDVLDVPYKGIPLAVADVISGTVDFTFGANPRVVDSLAKLGVTPAPLGPEELGAFIRREVAKWSELVKEAGITPE